MQRLYSSDDRWLIDRLRQSLERRGIGCLVRNEHLAGAAGELPINECWPEVWVLDDDQLSRARRALEELLNLPLTAAPDWRCPHCGEPLEGQFHQCWSCGALRD